MNVTHRQYRLLSDHMAVYDFMTEIYERDWRNGVAAACTANHCSRVT